MPDPHRRRAVQLRRIDREDDAAGIFEDRLRHAHFVDVEIEKVAIRLDPRCADQGEVDLEPPDEIDRERTDDRPVVRADAPAGGDDLDPGTVGENVDDVQIVGDDHQPAPVDKVLRNRLRRRADVDEQAAAIRDECRRRRADRGLRRRSDTAAFGVGEVVRSRTRDRAAVNARDQRAAIEQCQILADRLRRDAEHRGEAVDRDAAAVARDLDDPRLSRVAIDGSAAHFAR